MQIDNHTAKMDGLQYVSNIFPSYQKGNVKLINADCMEIMAQYPDKYFDLAVVDPPYGINIGMKKTIGKRGKTYSTTVYRQSNWDKAKPTKEYFNELFRVSKNQIVWGGNYFTDCLPPSAGWFIWDKNQPFEFSMAHAELAYTSFNRAIRTYKVKRSEHMNCVSNNKQVAL